MTHMAQAKQARQADPVAAESPSQILASARVMARALATTFPVDHQLALARAFGVRLIEAWWRGLTSVDIVPQELRSPLQPFPIEPLPEAAAALAETIGHTAASFDAETAAYQIGLTYTSMLPAEHRGEYGIFYTPPVLTARLIDQVTAANVDWARCRVLDPACGGLPSTHRPADHGRTEGLQPEAADAEHR